VAIQNVGTGTAAQGSPSPSPTNAGSVLAPGIGGLAAVVVAGAFAML
jgi:hypothetical protein